MESDFGALIAIILIFLGLRGAYFILRCLATVLALRGYLARNRPEEHSRIFGDMFPLWSPLMGLLIWEFILSRRVEEDTRTQDIKQKIRTSLFQYGISVGLFFGIFELLSFILG